MIFTGGWPTAPPLPEVLEVVLSPLPLACRVTTGSASSVGSGSPSTLALSTFWYSCAAGESYFRRIAAAASVGFAISFASILIPLSSRNALQASLPPPAFIKAIWSGDHESIFTLRTKDTWVPKLRWTPLQSRHTRMPSLTDAHWGFMRSQSMQRLFPGRARIMATSSRSIDVMLWISWY
ncbi:unnamed protein product [Pseudo-nitzschia multistriata]|uniref:Uncharacterized protein n=1 Tax=Pseudo-nitzschia multistriata TaxID=183589 RepID=A0A448ZPC5_9STRA|nr:unnamed protein product [Pseudo-nitzschia multistriata]